MNPQEEELQGTVDRLLFKSPDSGYCVLILQINDTRSTVVTGSFGSIQAGEQVTLKGSWITHAKFGRQFQATGCIQQLPTTLLGVQKYLGSGLIKGIGKVYAKKLVAKFGTDTLAIIDKNPERLSEIPGIGAKRIELINRAWQDQKEISSIMIFLQEKGISPAFAAKIYKKYGQNSIAVLKENPYRLAEEIWGIGFKSADMVAQQLGFEKNSIKRVKAGFIYSIGQATNNGHLYVQLAELKNNVKELLELDNQSDDLIVKNALHELYESEKIKLISQDNQHFITLAPFYFSEKSLAQKILSLCEFKTPYQFDIDKIYTSLRVSDQHNVALNEEQQHAIITCLQQKVSIITGGPGTGKTTLIKKLLSILDEHKITYKLAAPTGRAAKRMMEGTGRYAATLHRLLEFDVSTMSFTHNEQNALKLDFLIIDEASMIDTFLAHAVLKAMPLNAHLIFIGDIDQLPSVGPGSVLKDLINSNKIAQVKLQHIFRQAQDSLIIINAHKINNGEFPTSKLPDCKKDFIYIKEEQPEEVFNHLKKIYSQLNSRFNIKNHNDSIVLVPMNRGIVGTFKLNHDLQSILNPENYPQHVSYAGNLFKPKDRVMQIRNNYDKSVFNGDIGFIESIDPEERTLQVNFDERLVEYAFDELNELVHAYAISIHKSQGSEYDVVIVPIFMQHFMLLQRNLIYTAITRAKKLCIFIGQTKALAMAIKNNKTVIRKTFLQEFLTTDLTCR
ncbi:MAG: ATP-dependent RecD-like DNA helicase [Candidatus Babeliales bacterium]